MHGEAEIQCLELVGSCLNASALKCLSHKKDRTTSIVAVTHDHHCTGPLRFALPYASHKHRASGPIRWFADDFPLRVNSDPLSSEPVSCVREPSPSFPRRTEECPSRPIPFYCDALTRQCFGIGSQNRKGHAFSNGEIAIRWVRPGVHYELVARGFVSRLSGRVRRGHNICNSRNSGDQTAKHAQFYH